MARIRKPKTVVVGRDARLSSPALLNALVEGFLEQGVDVASLGMCGTEELYYASANGDFDAGVMVTGSHNPADENGFKFVEKDAIPLSLEYGLRDIALEAAELMRRQAPGSLKRGSLSDLDMRDAWVDWLLEYSGLAPLAGAPPYLRVAVDAGNGCAGPALERMMDRLPVAIVPLNFEPDGTFPNGVPNPLLPERRRLASEAVIEHGADLGVAFDGDFDRCFFFDHRGGFVESCYAAGLLASELMAKRGDEKIVHDSRVYWSSRDLVIALGGEPIASRSGHTRMKETMRRERALYGAEMSGHHFYRDFAYCDSGMLTMLLMISLLIRTGHTLAELVDASESAYPCSGEVNFSVADAKRVIEEVWKKYRRDAVMASRMDGLNLEFPGWRFSLRASNTEPLLRLNIESRGDRGLVQEKLEELSRFIQG